MVLPCSFGEQFSNLEYNSGAQLCNEKNASKMHHRPDDDDIRHMLVLHRYKSHMSNETAAQ